MPISQQKIFTGKILDRGEGKDAGIMSEEEVNLLLRSLPGRASELTDKILRGDWSGIDIWLLQAADVVKLQNMRKLRERNLYADRIMIRMEIRQLDEDIKRIESLAGGSWLAISRFLREAKDKLVEQIRAYVDNQFRLIVDGTGQRFIRESASHANLTAMQPYYFKEIREVVWRLAKRVIKKHSRRKKVLNRGKLDLKKTMRRNLAYDGNLFDLQWKQVKKELPAIFVLCDVSGSVRTVSRFLMTFIDSLDELIPKVRSFAFSNDLGEVTQNFRQYRTDEAIEMSLNDWGRGSTDYGRMFTRFSEICLEELNSKTTIIILGDGRNNFYDPAESRLKEISRRAGQVIWLNPEPKHRWLEGDSVMRLYLPYCSHAAVCNSLSDLERLAGRILE